MPPPHPGERSNPARRSSLTSALTGPSPASLGLTGRGSPASLGEPWRALASLGEPLASLGEPKAHGEPWRAFLGIRDPNSGGVGGQYSKESEKETSPDVLPNKNQGGVPSRIKTGALLVGLTPGACPLK